MSRKPEKLIRLKTFRPVIVCLCGSTRFYKEYQQAYFAESLAGRIVLSVGFYPHAGQEVHGHNIGLTSAQKQAMDVLHLRKIDLADEVLVIDVQGYIGESTRQEIAYAIQREKRVRYLSREQSSTGLETARSADASHVKLEIEQRASMKQGTMVRIKNPASVFNGRLGIFERYVLPDLPNPAVVIRLILEDTGPGLSCHLDELEPVVCSEESGNSAES